MPTARHTEWIPRLARDLGSLGDRSGTERVLESAADRARQQLLTGREELPAGSRALRGVLGHMLRSPAPLMVQNETLCLLFGPCPLRSVAEAWIVLVVHRLRGPSSAQQFRQKVEDPTNVRMCSAATVRCSTIAPRAPGVCTPCGREVGEYRTPLGGAPPDAMTARTTGNGDAGRFHA